MNTQGNRLKEIRKELNLSQEELGRRLDLTRASIAAVEADKNKFSNEVLCKLILTFNVNANYFLIGEGDMFRGNAEQFEQVRPVLALEVRKILREEGLIK